MNRRRSAALMVAAGIGLAVFSLIAEDIGLGSGNGFIGAWQKTGFAVGLGVVFASMLWRARQGPTWAAPPYWETTRPAPSEAKWGPTDAARKVVKDAVVIAAVFMAVVVARFAFWLAASQLPIPQEHDSCDQAKELCWPEGSGGL